MADRQTFIEVLLETVGPRAVTEFIDAVGLEFYITSTESGDVTFNAYIDDFEGAKTTIDLKAQYAWVIASTPKGQTELFPEGDIIDDLQNDEVFYWLACHGDLEKLVQAQISRIESIVHDGLFEVHKNNGEMKY